MSNSTFNELKIKMGVSVTVFRAETILQYLEWNV